jgi:hypothetical protein
MSSSINVYAVAVEQLKQAIGSRDEALIETIVSQHEDFLASIDDIDDEAEFSCAEAVADLINGAVSEDAPAYFYGYALEAICSHLGEELPNICPISGSSEWMKEVDALLERKGIPIRVNQLVFGGSPVRIPTPGDCPFIGRWTEEACAAGKNAFDNANLADVDPEMAETLQQFKDWVEVAAQTPGTSVIGFLS